MGNSSSLSVPIEDVLKHSVNFKHAQLAMSSGFYPDVLFTAVAKGDKYGCTFHVTTAFHPALSSTRKTFSNSLQGPSGFGSPHPVFRLHKPHPLLS